MNSFLQFTLVAVLGVEVVTGILGNAFTILVNITDWVKRRKISSVDLILTALAISRVALLWPAITGIPLLYPASVMIGKMMRMFNNSWVLTTHFSIWLATCLSIFYFLKIANFSNSLFLYLKWRVNSLVSVTLLVSLVPLCANIVIINMLVEEWIGEFKANMSDSFTSNDFIITTRSVLLTNSMFALIPFTVSLITCLLLIFSLCKHLKSMRHYSKDSRDVSTTAHINALKTVVTFLLLYTVFFISLVLLSQKSAFQQGSPRVLFLSITGFAFPFGHSYVLILGNSKLRQASRSVLWCTRCRIKDAEL